MTWDSISQPGAAAWAPLRMGQVYGAKLMELSAENVNSTLEFFGELSGAKTPADFAEAVGNETRRRLDALTEQFDELSRLFGATKADDKAVDVDDIGLGDSPREHATQAVRRRRARYRSPSRRADGFPSCISSAPASPIGARKRGEAAGANPPVRGGGDARASWFRNG